jgi:hypothetical protein
LPTAKLIEQLFGQIASLMQYIKIIFENTKNMLEISFYAVDLAKENLRSSENDG